MVAVLALLASTLAAASIQHLNFSAQLGNRGQAANLADSVVGLAVANLMSNRSYGASGETARIQRADGGSALLCFDPAVANQAGIPWSTYNLDHPGSQPGWGGTAVPGAAVRLLGVGSYRGASVTVEAVFHVPPFPYVIASSGPFRSSGGLTVGGVSQAQDTSGTLDPSQLLPGDLASNGTDPQALVLGPQTQVTGNARTAGGAQLDPNSQIQGQLLTHSAPVAIPHIDIRSYDPLATGKTGVQQLATSLLTAPVLQGFARRQGDLSITSGLQLDGGVLYVDGNLNVQGGLSGRGAVIVTGNTTLAGATVLTTDNVAALLSGGDVVLSGSSADLSQYRGLVYTQGNFTANHMTLLGTFIANAAAPGSTMTVDASRLVYVPDYAAVNVTQTFTAASTQQFFAYLRDNGSKPMNSADPGQLQVVRTGVSTYQVQSNRGSFPGNNQDMSADEAVNQLDNVMSQLNRGYNGMTTSLRSQVLSVLASMTPQGAQPGSGGGASTVTLLTIDPSQFLQPEDRIRQLLWRRL